MWWHPAHANASQESAILQQAQVPILICIQPHIYCSGKLPSVSLLELVIISIPFHYLNSYQTDLLNCTSPAI